MSQSVFESMGIPRPGQPRMDPEELYRRIGRLIQSIPEVSEDGPLSADCKTWIGRVAAVIDKFADLGMSSQAGNAINGLNTPAPARLVNFEKLLVILYRALARAEIDCPPGVQGAFIPAGSPFDALQAVGKIFGEAKKDILIVDPYMDRTVLSDFAATAPENVALRLLTDPAYVRQDLEPAGRRWKVQYPSRSLEIRYAPARALHDRAFLIDSTQAWTVTQSLKDFATRAHGEIVRADDIAQLKIAAYEDVWSKARPVV